MSEALQVLGAIAATGAGAGAILTADRRARAILLAISLGLAFALLAGEGWDQLESVRERPALALVLAIAGVGGVAVLATLIRRRPLLLPVLLVAALPFRVPIEVGGDDVNLLLPLYAVIAGGVAALAIDAFRGTPSPGQAPPRPLLVALAAVLVLYALQSAYSEDIGFAARNVGFFLAPFAAMFVLLVEQRWTGRLLAVSLAIVVGESALFALVGIGQAIAADIFWNPALERSNDFHFYFRVNSLFWDPNIYGRYLSMAAVLLAAVIAWTRDSRRIAILAGALGLILVGLMFGYSQTSFIALLCGTAVVCALRWSVRWTAIAAPVAAGVILATVIVIGGTSASEDSAREISSGRTTLVEGGAELAVNRPLYGHGSASFAVAFAEQEEISPKQPPISHNEPITVAAEQGAIGLIAYAGLIAAALWTLLAGMRALAPGLGAAEDAIGDPAKSDRSALALGRVAVLATFAALLVHTIGYAGFLTDPLSWALLAIGGSLASNAGSSASRPGPA